MLFRRGPDMSKSMSVNEAVARFVRPGMRLHTLQTGLRWPTAAMHAVARQFWGQNPAFELIAFSANHPHAVWVEGGLVKKVISSYCGEPYRTPGPNPAFQRAWKDGRVELEMWSILTLPLRLKAAAQGLPWLPTRSLLGSSMETDNADALTIVDDPDGQGRVALVHALYPDVSLVHAWMADELGNAVFGYPQAENAYGALAAREGAIVTAEHIVDSATLRRHAHLVQLPGDYVRAVCPSPWGAHPGGMSCAGVPEFTGYAEDYDFVDDARKAGADAQTLRAWIDEWVLGCDDPQAYAENLGQARRQRLRQRAKNDAAQLSRDLPDAADTPPNAVERMLCAAASLIRERVVAAGHTSLLAGAGQANLAAWVAHRALAGSERAFQLMAEVGLYGYTPAEGDPAVFNQANYFSCTTLTDTHRLMGIHMAGAQARCLGVMGFGQIDARGNINTTLIPGKLLIAGSGGANDIASNARELLVVGRLSPKRCIEEVPYITSPGHRVNTLVTDHGVFEKDPATGRLRLTRLLHDDSGTSDELRVSAIRQACGFSFETAPELQQLEAPSAESLAQLRRFDPNRWFLD